MTDEIIPPGGAAEIDTGGLPIQQAVMGMPYKDMSPQVIAFIAQLREVAARLGSAAELPVGEGKADVPVGTMLAMIEDSLIIRRFNQNAEWLRLATVAVQALSDLYQMIGKEHLAGDEEQT